MCTSAALRRAVWALLGTAAAVPAPCGDAACAAVPGAYSGRPSLAELLSADAAEAASGGEEHLRLLQLRARAVGGRPTRGHRHVEESRSAHASDSDDETAAPAPAAEGPVGVGCNDDTAPCRTGHTCVKKLDGSYSQCVVCINSHFQRECAWWDNDLRLAATLTCRKQCEKAPPIQPCSIGASLAAYAGKNCVRSRTGVMTMKCKSKSPDDCGTLLGSDHPAGVGAYSVSLRAARGPGVATTFYLYTWGEDNERTRPWNEIDFEILGNKAEPDSSLVWTNFFMQPYNSNAPKELREEEHHMGVTVPFDVTADFHNYTILVGAATIEWMVDGVSYRTVDFSASPDMVKSVAESRLRMYLGLWGQNSTSGVWKEMGFIEKNELTFPLTAAFKDPKMPAGPDAPDSE